MSTIDTPLATQIIRSFGPTLLTPQRTRFRLWAPDLEQVSVELDGGTLVPMQHVEDGWYECEAECGAGTRYRFRVRPDVSVPDPASQQQDGDVHDASIVVDHDAYVWRNTGWKGRPWHETVLYELHVGAMRGFRGVMSRLPELAALGITAIELMPVADFPGQRNWGYDGVLIYAPDGSYGTPDDLKELIDTAHGLGMMVFLDVVYNHFGPAGNYLNQYASGFFDEGIKTNWGAAIDFKKPAVRNFFIENSIYWLLEYRFDGLRFDAVHAIPDADFMKELATRVRASINPERHVHLVLEHEDNRAHLLEQGFDAQWNDDIHHVLHVMLTQEIHGYYSDYADTPAALLARCLKEGFAYQGEASAFRNGAPRGEASHHLSPTSFIAFLQNHDQIGNRACGERINTLADSRAIRAAAALVLLSPQIPMLFMGEEWGCTQPFNYFADHEEELAVAISEGRRREFAFFPEFANAESLDAIPDPCDVATFHLSVPDDPDPALRNHARWLQFYRTMLAIRHSRIVPLLREARALGAKPIGNEAVCARWKLGDAVLCLHTNLSADEIPIEKVNFSEHTELLFETTAGAIAKLHDGHLPGYTTVAIFEAPED